VPRSPGPVVRFEPAEWRSIASRETRSALSLEIIDGEGNCQPPRTSGISLLGVRVRGISGGLPPAVGKPSELADRFASNLLMLDYFQTGAFLGASKETTLRRVLKATSFGISGLTTSRSAGRTRFNH
jgi:hypothetical protein